MKKLIVANWKENPKTEAQALALFKSVAAAKRGSNVHVAVCPPAIYLDGISRAFKKLSNKKNLSIGAQNVFWEEEGPYTGEVGPRMLQSLGVQLSIIGHSERRKWLHETDATVNKKLKAALASGLNIILCVGEPLSVRKKGISAAHAFVKNQLKKDFAGVKISGRLQPNAFRIVVAYEPIWAIGTGRYDEPEDAAASAAFIKKTLKSLYGLSNVPVLYGGSVNSGNIKGYVQYKEIDGALVGGASLKAEEFKKIITITSKQ